MSKIFRENQLLLLIPIFLFSLSLVGCKKEVKTETETTETNTTVIVDTTAQDTMILDTADTRPTEKTGQ